MVFRVKIPPVRNRAALEDDEEEVKGTEKNTAGDEDADDPDLQFVYGDSVQEETNRDLEQSRTRCVKGFAKIPILVEVRACLGPR